MRVVHFVGGERTAIVPAIPFGEVWTCNRVWRWRPWLPARCSLWFDLHQLSLYADDPEHVRFLESLGRRAMMSDPLPSASPFPKEPLLAGYGSRMWNTPGWLCAYALETGVGELHLWACDPMKIEKRAEALGFVWWCGYSESRGMRIVPHGGWLAESCEYGSC